MIIIIISDNRGIKETTEMISQTQNLRQTSKWHYNKPNYKYNTDLWTNAMFHLKEYVSVQTNTIFHLVLKLNCS